MPSNPLDLANHKLSENYPRFVQYSEGLFYDGLGNLLPLGNSGGTYAYLQSIPDTIWVIAHNLGYKPGCNITDSANDVVYGDIHHDSDNQLTITFLYPFSGQAICS